jgi:hypothetical protein
MPSSADQAGHRLSRRSASARIFRALAALMLSGSIVVRGEDASTRESAIKAAYLFNFIKYIDWPPDVLGPQDSEIHLGVLGENPFGKALQTLEGKMVKGRRLSVREAHQVADLKGCQLVFISASESDRLAAILQALKHYKVLTVGESQGFAENGGIINFIEERNKVRFQINLEAAKRCGLTISSDLLKLAKIVGA